MHFISKHRRVDSEMQYSWFLRHVVLHLIYILSHFYLPFCIWMIMRCHRTARFSVRKCACAEMTDDGAKSPTMSKYSTELKWQNSFYYIKVRKVSFVISECAYFFQVPQQKRSIFNEALFREVTFLPRLDYKKNSKTFCLKYSWLKQIEKLEKAKTVKNVFQIKIVMVIYEANKLAHWNIWYIIKKSSKTVRACYFKANAWRWAMVCSVW